MNAPGIVRVKHDVEQGSDAWHALRLSHLCASDAPAMMGAKGAKETRSDLIRRLATYSDNVFSGWVKANLLDKGHEVEANVRVDVENTLFEEFPPAVMTCHIEGLPLLASLDGLTEDGVLILEAKTANKENRACVANGNVPDFTVWQIEQGLLVSGATACIYAIGDEGEETQSVRYESVPARRAALLAGWKQLHTDCEEYRSNPPAPDPVPVIAEVFEDLPAVTIQVTGQVALISNLDVFGTQLAQFVEQIDMEPKTDDGFATAENAVKVFKRAEDALTSAESGALAQTATIDNMRKTVSNLRETCRTTRLALERVVTSRKDFIRNEALHSVSVKLQEHKDALAMRIGIAMPMIQNEAGFAAVIKGLKTLASIRNALDSELARCKIEASALADKIEANLKAIDSAGFPLLFPDRATIAQKATDDLQAVIDSRIAAHKTQEAERKAEEDNSAKLAQQSANALALSPAPVPAQGAIPETQFNAAPAQAPTVATDYHPEIDEFICGRKFGEQERYRIRSVLVEFVKFQERRSVKR